MPAQCVLRINGLPKPFPEGGQSAPKPPSGRPLSGNRWGHELGTRKLAGSGYGRQCPIAYHSSILGLLSETLRYLDAAVTQKLWRLETMKISKFLWSVLVLFATGASIAPQQVKAIIIDGRVGGNVVLTGSGTITESSA